MIDSHSPAQIQPSADLYALTEDIETYPGCGYPSGAPTRIWQAIDRLKEAGCSTVSVGHAEKIAVAMAYLQAAMREPAPNRAAKTRLAKIQVGKLGREWLNALPMELSRQ